MKFFYENEARRIAELNEIFGEVELTAVEKRTLIWLATDKAKKQADKYQKCMNELVPMVKNMERLAAEFSANPEETLPEVAVMESAKSYREKKAKPLVEKMVKVLRSVYSAFLDISRKYERLEEAYDREKAGKKRLNERLQEVLNENRELWEVTTDMERVKAAFGSHQGRQPLVV